MGRPKQELAEMGWNDALGALKIRERAKAKEFAIALLNDKNLRGPTRETFSNKHYLGGVREVCTAYLEDKEPAFKGPAWVVEDLEAHVKSRSN